MDELAKGIEAEAKLAQLLGEGTLSVEELTTRAIQRAENVKAYEAEQEAFRDKQERLRAKALRGSAVRAIEGIPVARELVDAIVDNALDRTTPALSAARTWLEERRAKRAKPILVLLSGIGVGKTVAAAWLAAQTGGAYVKMRDFAHLYRAGFGEDAARFQELLSAKLLIIDELTTERDVDLGRAALHEVVDERGSKDRGLVLIANRTRQEIAERYDARTIDRLRENATAIDLPGKSMRKGAW